jgi:hypothetical protein
VSNQRRFYDADGTSVATRNSANGVPNDAEKKRCIYCEENDVEIPAGCEAPATLKKTELNACRHKLHTT